MLQLWYSCLQPLILLIITEQSCNGTQDGQLRLVGGRGNFEGRVEICYEGLWGTVCDGTSSWNPTDAQVVCRQLGFDTTGAMALRFAPFGEGTGPIFLDDVGCMGSELTLISCPRPDSVGVVNCGHNNDVGVQCPAGGKI